MSNIRQSDMVCVGMSNNYSYWTDYNYVYQYCLCDHFVNGKYLKNRCIGWLCSYEAWMRTMHKIIK